MCYACIHSIMSISLSFALHCQSCLIVVVMEECFSSASSMAGKGQGDFCSHWYIGCAENFLKAVMWQVTSCEMQIPIYKLNYKYWRVWTEILYVSCPRPKHNNKNTNLGMISSQIEQNAVGASMWRLLRSASVHAWRCPTLCLSPELIQ